MLQTSTPVHEFLGHAPNDRPRRDDRLTPALRPGWLQDVLISAASARDEGRLLLALERLESVPAATASSREVVALRTGLRVAIGHLTHARLMAPRSGVVAVAAGELSDVLTTPEQVDRLAAQARAGATWAVEELAAVAEASARTDDRRAWHASERAARALLPDAGPRTRASLVWILSTATHRRGDASGAAKMLRTLPDGDPARLPEIASIAVVAGDEDLGRRAQATALRLTQRNAGVLLLSALSDHVAAIVGADVGALRRSAAVLAEARRPLLYGAAAERAGMLAEAHRVYDRCGATGDAERVRRAMTADGVQPVVASCDWETLTEAELRVVRLVAAGATNRRAAHELFLSPHTVSSHLRHAFEKLGIRSRVELARLYAHRESSPSAAM